MIIGALPDPELELYQNLLIEAKHSAGIVRLSTLPYFDGINYWDNWLTADGMPLIEESLDNAVAIGDFRAVNPLNPEQWDSYEWHGYECNFYVGDQRAALSTYQLVASMLLQDVQRQGSSNLFLFDVVDKGYLTTKAVLSESDTATVLNLGVIRNITPVLSDAANAVYRVHSGAVQGVSVVRDNGIPVQFTLSAIAGLITLANNPVGTVSCAIEQSSGRLPELVDAVLVRVGLEAEFVNMHGWQMTAILGYSVAKGATVETILDDLCNSVGAYWRLMPNGKIQIFSDVGETNPPTLYEDDMPELQVGALYPAVSKITVGYAPNFAVVDRSVMAGAVEATAVTAADAEYLASERLYESESTFAPTGVLSSVHEVNTHLMYKADALLLLALLKARWGKTRRLYTAQLRRGSLAIQLGTWVYIAALGKAGMVWSIRRSPLAAETEVEVLV